MAVMLLSVFIHMAVTFLSVHAHLAVTFLSVYIHMVVNTYNHTVQQSPNFRVKFEHPCYNIVGKCGRTQSMDSSCEQEEAAVCKCNHTLIQSHCRDVKILTRNLGTYYTDCACMHEYVFDHRPVFFRFARVYK